MNRWSVAALSAAGMYALLALMAERRDEERARDRERVVREAFRKR
jgi:hypothetical protein